MINYLETQELLKLFSLKELKQRDDVIIVDVREPQEFQHEHIEQAMNIPLSQLAKLQSPEYHDKTAIFHCRSGKRTVLNEQALDHTAFKTKYCLNTGIEGWKQANLPTVNDYAAPVDVMRQVQLIVGFMILLGIILSYVFSSYFIILPIIAGCGLLVAGFTGYCGMAEILKYLPWNQSKHKS